MDIVFNVFLALHICGGAVGLLTGTTNLLQKKGGKRHQRIGRAFVYAMLTTGFSSLVLAAMHPNYFLFITGVFTIYMVLTGNRYIYLKLLGRGQEPAALDWAITWCMAATGILFVGLGIRSLVLGNNFGIVLIVFGALGLRFVVVDFANYKGKAKAKNYWLLLHLQRMTGAYIAAVTAFLVVNAKYFPTEIPPVVGWLLPTAVLTPLIISWSRKYAR